MVPTSKSAKNTNSRDKIGDQTQKKGPSKSPEEKGAEKMAMENSGNINAEMSTNDDISPSPDKKDPTFSNKDVSKKTAADQTVGNASSAEDETSTNDSGRSTHGVTQSGRMHWPTVGLSVAISLIGAGLINYAFQSQANVNEQIEAFSAVSSDLEMKLLDTQAKIQGQQQVVTTFELEIQAMKKNLSSMLDAVGEQSIEVSSLGERLSKAEAAIAVLRTTTANSATSEDAQKALNTATSIMDIAGRNQNDVQDLKSQVVQLSVGLDQLRNDLGGLSNSVSEITAKTIALSNLKNAIDRGGAFADELQIASAYLDEKSISTLSALANNGVMTTSQLNKAFSSRAFDIISSANPQDDDGILSSLWKKTTDSVKVRRFGDVEGDGVDATVARLENALADGNLEAAMSEFNALPESAQVFIGDLKNQIEARLETNRLMLHLLTMEGGSADNISQ